MNLNTVVSRLLGLHVKQYLDDHLLSIYPHKTVSSIQKNRQKLKTFWHQKQDNLRIYKRPFNWTHLLNASNLFIKNIRIWFPHFTVFTWKVGQGLGFRNSVLYVQNMGISVQWTHVYNLVLSFCIEDIWHKVCSPLLHILSILRALQFTDHWPWWYQCTAAGNANTFAYTMFQYAKIYETYLRNIFTANKIYWFLLFGLFLYFHYHSLIVQDKGCFSVRYFVVGKNNIYIYRWKLMF